MSTVQKSLVTKMASAYAVEPVKFLDTLRATAFRDARTNEELMALMIVADKYQLNPFTREIYAFVDRKRGGAVVPIVGLDGHIRIITSHPLYVGMTIVESPEEVEYKNGNPCPKWIEATCYRKGAEHNPTVRERLADNYRDTQPWQQNTSRMLRHRAVIQAGRYAFGFSGIYTQDEAEVLLTAGPDLSTATALNMEFGGAAAQPATFSVPSTPEASPEENAAPEPAEKPKKRRGRPRKNPEPESEETAEDWTLAKDPLSGLGEDALYPSAPLPSAKHVENMDHFRTAPNLEKLYEIPHPPNSFNEEMREEQMSAFNDRKAELGGE